MGFHACLDPKSYFPKSAILAPRRTQSSSNSSRHRGSGSARDLRWLRWPAAARSGLLAVPRPARGVCAARPRCTTRMAGLRGACPLLRTPFLFYVFYKGLTVGIALISAHAWHPKAPVQASFLFRAARAWAQAEHPCARRSGTPGRAAGWALTTHVLKTHMLKAARTAVRASTYTRRAMLPWLLLCPCPPPPSRGTRVKQR